MFRNSFQDSLHFHVHHLFLLIGHQIHNHALAILIERFLFCLPKKALILVRPYRPSCNSPSSPCLRYPLVLQQMVYHGASKIFHELGQQAHNCRYRANSYLRESPYALELEPPNTHLLSQQLLCRNLGAQEVPL